MNTFGAGRSGVLLVLLIGCLAPRVALAQECDEDADCGHGFQCIHDSAGTSSVTGVGGSSMPDCGDGICEGGLEDIESCPEDCDTIQYCAPAECASNADCAEGYECGEEVGSNSGFTSAGGSSGSVCGDGLCDSDESEESCPDDCRTYRLCRVAQVQCETDEDCADGFYCALSGGSNSGTSGFSVAVSNVDSGSATVDSGSDGGDGTDGDDAATSAAPAQGSGGTSGAEDEMGYCLPEGTAGTGGSGSSNVGTVGGETSNGSGGDGSGGDGSGDDVNATSAGSGVGGESASANDSVSATGSDTDGAASDGGEGDGDDGDDGCSCAVPGSAGRTGMLGLLLAGLGVGLGWRRWRFPRR